MENLSSHDTKNTKSRRGRKGATQLTKLVQIRGGKKIHIDLDERGEPIDRGKGNLFKSFVGLTARQKISILENEWDDVKESDRDEVWNTILFTYDIPDNKFLKKKWLSYAGRQWKDFMSKLTRKYVFSQDKDKENDDGGGKNNSVKYPFIDYGTWMKFVEIRQHADFLEKSQKGKQRRKKNQCNHTLSRGGYALLYNV